jgi:hypothetical protein
MTRGRNFRLLMTLVLLFLAFGVYQGQAQPVKPVITQTSLDGQLIGIETDLQFGIWKPIAALAYGLESQRFRYRVGLTLATGLKLPLAGLELRDFSGALVDWPMSPILGREGQSGLELGMDLGPTRYRAFFGRLWQVADESEAPQVAYLAADVTRTWQLPFDLLLSSSSHTILGMVLSGRFEDRNPFQFQSMTSALSLSLGGLRMSGRWGRLQNGARLEGFQFTTGVRGITQALKGHEFWNVTLERTFPMYETAIELPTPPELVRFLPRSLPVTLQGVLFVQAGSATHRKEGEDLDAHQANGGNGPQPQPELETEMLFSWGISVILSIHQLRVRAELVITQDGETRFNFSF